MRLYNFGKNMRRTQSSLSYWFLHQCSWGLLWKCQAAAAKAWKHLWGSGSEWKISEATAHTSTALYYWFQFEVSLRKAAEHLVHLPPKTKPQLQPQSQLPFCVAKLRQGERSEARPRPPPESADAPDSSQSCRSAIQFMSRVLQRLREVDEHVSEVITVSSLPSFVSLCCPLFFFFFLNALAARSQNRTQTECWLHTMHWLYT